MATQTPSAKKHLKFDIYVVDSGWKTSIHKELVDNLSLLTGFLQSHNLHILDSKQSIRFLREHSHLITSEPMVLAVDPELLSEMQAGRVEFDKETPGYGIRLNLGQVRDETHVVPMLKWFLEVLCNHVTARQVARIVRETAHKEGISGAIEIVADTTGKLLAPE